MEDEMTKDCKEIIKDYLIANGYDGLVCIEGECGCELDDFNACGEDLCGCQPSYVWRNACKDCTRYCAGYYVGDNNYCMRLEKQKTV